MQAKFKRRLFQALCKELSLFISISAFMVSSTKPLWSPTLLIANISQNIIYLRKCKMNILYSILVLPQIKYTSIHNGFYSHLSAYGVDHMVPSKIDTRFANVTKHLKAWILRNKKITSEPCCQASRTQLCSESVTTGNFIHCSTVNILDISLLQKILG